MSLSEYVSVVLTRLISEDNDVRFMAVTDLTQELRKDTFNVSEHVERSMVAQLLRALEDKSSEVQNLVVKSLPLLVVRLRDQQLEEVIERLCRLLTAEREDLRDLAGIGLKTVVLEVAPGSSVLPGIVRRLAPRLIVQLDPKQPYEVVMSSLDILCEMLFRFGDALALHYQSLTAVLPTLLAYPRPAVRKRAAAAIGHLVRHLTDSAFSDMFAAIARELAKSDKPELTRSYINCVTTITRHSGKRIGRHVHQILPLLFELLRKQSDDELRENCLQALEWLQLRCPHELAGSLDEILRVAVALVKHDPNYDVGMDDDEADEADDADDGDADDDAEPSDEEADGDYSDDDDLSWKVRRASAELIAAIISTRGDVISKIFTDVVPTLISRIKNAMAEREETVRLAVMGALTLLFRHVAQLTRQLAAAAEDRMETEESHVMAQMRNVTPSVCRAAAQQLRVKSVKGRQHALVLIRALIAALAPSAELSSRDFSLLSKGVLAALRDATSTASLRIEALFVVRTVVRRSAAIVADKGALAEFAVPISDAAKDKYYKTAAEALATAADLVTPLVEAQRFSELAHIFNVGLSRMRSADATAEVKERAIQLCATVVAAAANVIGEQRAAETVALIVEKLSSEMTRLCAIHSLILIGRSPHGAALFAPIAAALLGDLAVDLRKSDRSLRAAALELVHVVMDVAPSAAAVAALPASLQTVLVDVDLQLLPMALSLAARIARLRDAQCDAAMQSGAVVDAAVALAKAPTVQGAALTALADFFRALVESNAQHFASLRDKLWASAATDAPAVSLAAHRQSFMTIAVCIAALCRGAPAHIAPTVQSLLGQIKAPETSDALRCLALLTIGEIGRHSDLSHLGDLPRELLALFAAPVEEVKTAAAYALGNVCVGNLQLYLPMILAELQSAPKRNYLLLSALREIIVQSLRGAFGGAALLPFASSIWSLLFDDRQSAAEEGTRNVVAECVGRLARADVQRFLPELEGHLKSTAPETRATVAAAAKFALGGGGGGGGADGGVAESGDGAAGRAWAPLVAAVMPLMLDSDLTVRLVAVQAIYSAAHNHPFIVRDLIQQLQPLAYESTVVRKEWIREIAMGPFKHEVDDGLEIRKSAYDLLNTLLDCALDRLDMSAFIDRIVAGLADRPEIRASAHLMLSRLCHLAPSHVVRRLDDFFVPLEATLRAKPKPNAVKQEIDKNAEQIRGALRAIASLSRLPKEMTSGSRLPQFIQTIKDDAELGPKFGAILAETDKEQQLTDAMDLA